MNHAEALFEIATSEINASESPSVLLALGRVTKKMGLYDSEKKKLILKYIYKEGNSDINNMLADHALELF